MQICKYVIDLCIFIFNVFLCILFAYIMHVLHVEVYVMAYFIHVN